jgi:hypothetical protein
MICDVLPRDSIDGREDRNDVDSGRARFGIVRGNALAMGVNICTSGVIVVGRSKRDKGGIRGILSVSLHALC